MPVFAPVSALRAVELAIHGYIALTGTGKRGTALGKTYGFAACRARGAFAVPPLRGRRDGWRGARGRRADSVLPGFIDNATPDPAIIARCQ